MFTYVGLDLLRHLVAMLCRCWLTDKSITLLLNLYTYFLFLLIAHVTYLNLI